MLALIPLAWFGFLVQRRITHWWLLIGELAYGSGSARVEDVKLAVLIGSLIAAALAAAVLGGRNRVYHLIHLAEEPDDDVDGISNTFQADTR